jgi:hypothetical protein
MGERKQVVKSALIEQCVSTGAHPDVDVGLGNESGRHRRLVHADTDGTDDALVAEPAKRRDRLAARLMPMIIRIVHEHDPDGTDTEAREALIERANDDVSAEVEDSCEVGVDHEAVVTPRRADPAGTRRRPTFIDNTVSVRGRVASASPSRSSDRPSP